MRLRDLLPLAALAFFSFLPLRAFPQTILASYERSFLRAGLSAKADVLHDAATDERAGEFLGELYDFSLAFSIRNADILRDDPDFIALTALAAREMGSLGYRAGAGTLWTVFSSFRDTVVRVEAATALASLATGDMAVAEYLERFIEGQNSLHRSGAEVDYVTLSACAAALGAIAGDAAIPCLFAVMTAGYPSPVPENAEKALESLPNQGEYRSYLGEVIRRGPAAGKLEAFRAGMRNAAFTDADKGEIAERALAAALDVSGMEGDPVLGELRLASAWKLGELRWVRAAPLVLRHYNLLHREYLAGSLPRELLIRAIGVLAVMESAEAAQVLNLQLGRSNSGMEHSVEADGEIVLALVTALGELGHKAAFDNLARIEYLPYPEPIQTAAREASSRLRW